MYLQNGRQQIEKKAANSIKIEVQLTVVREIWQNYCIFAMPRDSACTALLMKGETGIELILRIYIMNSYTKQIVGA